MTTTGTQLVGHTASSIRHPAHGLRIALGGGGHLFYIQPLNKLPEDRPSGKKGTHRPWLPVRPYNQVYKTNLPQRIDLPANDLHEVKNSDTKLAKMARMRKVCATADLNEWAP